MKTKADIVFFNLPPVSIRYPNPAFSILSSYLSLHGLTSETIYLNTKFGLTNYDNANMEFKELIPFLYILNQEYNDLGNLEILKQMKYSADPLNYLANISVAQDSFEQEIAHINDVIDSTVSELLNAGVKAFGFSEKFWQWIPSIIIAKRLKKKNPFCKIIIGGFGDKNKAGQLLESIEWFDFAIWGEGEDALTKLLQTIQIDSIDYFSIPHLAFRGNSKIDFSKHKSEYLNLDLPLLPDYSSFFENINDISLNNVLIPIETSRGCHWNKCNFCYLNSGYRYRKCNSANILLKIESLVTIYGCNQIIFIDNDLIGKSINDFVELLELLIKYKEEKNNSFKIENAEIIPFKKDSSIIKKMSLAGFEKIQIGYEALSESLLNNMQKKQSLALNIFIVKFCLVYNIKVSGANIITGVIDESTNDIIDSMRNLQFFRFYLGLKGFSHEVTNLSISKNSRYYKKMKNEDYN